MKKSNQIILAFIFVLCLCFGYPVHSNATTIVETENDDAFMSEIKKLCKEYSGKSTSISSESGDDSDSEYELKRLIVRSTEDKIDLDDIDPAKVVKSDDGLYVIQFDDVASAEEAAELLERQSDVKYVEADKKISIPEIETSAVSTASASSASTYGNWSWGVDYMGINNYAAQVKQCVGSSSIKIAVVDSGIEKHTSFSKHIISGYSYVTSEKSTTDLNGHGTHVTGIIYDCLRGFNVSIMPIKVLNQYGDGNSLWMGLGINYAVEHGAKVINLSANLTSDAGHDDWLHECVEDAVANDVIVVNSSGNDGKNTSKSCPAHLTAAIVVGAASSNGSQASFSNTGDSVDVLAPGVNVKSTYLSNKYTTLSGTSMAAPHITGLATLIRLAHPSYSAARVENVIKTYRSKGADSKIPYVGNVTLHPATSVSLNKTNVSLTVPETITLKATVSPVNTTRTTVTWSSSDTSIAVVTSGGKIIAKAAGTATITAKTANGKKTTCKVTVKAAAVPARTYYWLSTYSSSTKKAVMRVKQFESWNGMQIQLMDSKKNVITTKTATPSKNAVFENLSNQKTYYYRARTYKDVSGQRVYGNWESSGRLFSTVTATIKKSSSQKGVTITAPKVAGIKSYEVWISSSGKTDSYKKVKTLTAGKSFYCTSFSGKKLVSYGKTHKFYVILKPTYTLSGLGDKKYVRKSFTLK